MRDSAKCWGKALYYGLLLPIIILKVLGTTLTNVGNIVKYNKTL